MARALCPPEPRRGLLVIDPSYEVKADYATLPPAIAALHRKWNVGVILLWYPLLASGAERAMVSALDALSLPGAARHELGFPPARAGHGMIGSGLFIVNPPYPFRAEASALEARLAGIS